MTPARWARRTHKWLAVLVGVQTLIWMASGLYMTAIPIGTVHGDRLARRSLDAPLAGAGLLAPDAFASRFDGLHAFRLKHWAGRDVYEVRHARGTDLVDARTGATLTPLDPQRAAAVARAHYLGPAPVRSVTWLDTLPREIAGREPPLWRVEFDDGARTALYVSPHSGEMVGRRHRVWRGFDLLWGLHIMDYRAREDVNNALLRWASAAGVLFALGGAWLLWFSFARRRPA